MLDLGVNSAGSISLPAGTSVLSYTRFPGGFSAYELLDQLGQATARSVRMLDSQNGNWVAAQFQNGRPVGADFAIPSVAVLMIDLASPINNFTPQPQ